VKVFERPLLRRAHLFQLLKVLLLLSFLIAIFPRITDAPYYALGFFRREAA
jgi:hypothetical protein